MTTILKKDQAYEHIRRCITQGQWAPGQKLLQGVALAKQLGVSHITLRSAMARLAREGLVDSIHGRGTFVCQDPGGVVFRTIGVIMPSLGRPLTPELAPMHHSVVTSIMDAAEQRKFEIRTLHRGRKHIDSDAVRNMGVDGIVVLFPHSSDAGMLTELKSLNIPLVAFNLLNASLSLRHHCVNVDFARCASDSVSYLHEQGRRKIAFVSCFNLQPDLHPGCLLNGYLGRMAELGLSELIVHAGDLDYGPVELADAERHVRLHVRKLLGVEAIIATHTNEALAVQAALREHGRRVPEDTAVIGWADSAAAERAGVTTWRMPWGAIGREIVERLDRLLPAPKTPPQIVLLPCELIKRVSA